MDKLNKAQKFEIQHQAINQAQDQLDQEQKEELIANDTTSSSKIVEITEGNSNQNVDEKQEVVGSDEVNTEAWDID